MIETKAKQDSFSHEVIAEAALGILRNEGPGALSFRRVGEAVGTSHVTILRRCGSFDGLLDVCADHVAADFPEVSATDSWESATYARFCSAYDMWADNTGLMVLRRGRAWLGKNMTTRFYEPAMRTIVDAGIPVSAAGPFFSVLYYLTIGSVFASRANHWSPWESQEALERLGAHRFPTLARVEREAAVSDPRERFGEALRRLIVDLGSQKVDVQQPTRTTSHGT